MVLISRIKTLPETPCYDHTSPLLSTLLWPPNPVQTTTLCASLEPHFDSWTSHSLSCLWHQDWLSLPCSLPRIWLHSLVSTVLVFSCIHPGLWMSVSPTGLLRSAGWNYLAATQRYSCLRAFAFPLRAQLSFPVPSFLPVHTTQDGPILLKTAGGTLAPTAPISAFAWVVFWHTPLPRPGWTQHLILSECKAVLW